MTVKKECNIEIVREDKSMTLEEIKNAYIKSDDKDILEFPSSKHLKWLCSFIDTRATKKLSIREMRWYVSHHINKAYDYKGLSRVKNFLILKYATEYNEFLESGNFYLDEKDTFLYNKDILFCKKNGHLEGIHYKISHFIKIKFVDIYKDELTKLLKTFEKTRLSLNVIYEEEIGRYIDSIEPIMSKTEMDRYEFQMRQYDIAKLTGSLGSSIKKNRY